MNPFVQNSCSPGPDHRPAAQTHHSSVSPNQCCASCEKCPALFIYLRFNIYLLIRGFSGGSVVKNPPAMQEIQVQSLGLEDLPEEEMATHSSILT